MCNCERCVEMDRVMAPEPPERDPNGMEPHTPGAKLDANKPRVGMVLGGFSKALWAVSQVGTRGAEKYSPRGFLDVEGGFERYTDAMLRHWLAEEDEVDDEGLGLPHAACVAWNALARLELMLRDLEY